MRPNVPASERCKQLRKYTFASPLLGNLAHLKPLPPISELDDLLISKSLDRVNLPGYISSDDTEGEGCDSGSDSDSDLLRPYSPAVIKSSWHPAEILESSDSESEEEAKGLKDIQFKDRSLMAPKEVMFSYRRKVYQVAPKTVNANRSYSEGDRRRGNR
jgi:hypothetical protein